LLPNHTRRARVQGLLTAWQAPPLHNVASAPLPALCSGLATRRGRGEIGRVPALVDILAAISAAAFLFYGLACVFSRQLVAEFERYRLPQFRVLVGSLEVAGALGLIAGWWFPPLQAAAAAGLFMLMLCGLWARWRIRDPWYAMLPALILAGVNLGIVLLLVNR